jgi:Uma2 family endonuclease
MNVASKVRKRQPLLLTVQDYRTLADAGAFEGRPKVELIDGVILTVSPQRNWHLFVKSELGRRLGNKLEQLGLPLRAYVEGTVALSQHNAPEPDIIISSGGDLDDYLRGNAALLMIEVADTSARFDLGRKKQLYAEHRIPEYWVVTRKVVHRFSEPVGGSYRQGDERQFGQPVESATIPGLIIETAGIV